MRRRHVPVVPVLMVLVLVFLMAPLIVLVGAAVSPANYLEFPPRGFTLHWFQQVMDDPRWQDTALASLKLAFVSMGIAGAVGIPCAIALSRKRLPAHNLISGLVLSPLMIPSIVFAISLLSLYSRTNVDLPFWRLALAHSVLTAPYFVRTLTAALEQLDPRLEEAARNLGSRPVTAWLLVVLPSVRPALIAAMFFSFIISFDEVVVALFLSGPNFTTLPMQIYGQVQYNLDPTVAAVSAALILLSTFVALLMERVLGVRRLIG